MLSILPLRVCRSAGDWFENKNFIEGSVEQVNKSYAEWGKKVKQLAHKMATCQLNTNIY
jgi:hypothetical protein